MKNLDNILNELMDLEEEKSILSSLESIKNIVQDELKSRFMNVAFGPSRLPKSQETINGYWMIHNGINGFFAKNNDEYIFETVALNYSEYLPVYPKMNNHDEQQALIKDIYNLLKLRYEKAISEYLQSNPNFSH